ncbi:hypothetical protein [Nocardia transvalensis]|uniref:hypothetical protein n=1 Tax=Nocardia transvalensis TaxID=37333 RepID=UPI0018960AC7|nr:hypothetical protein [Nocardia transvalensis]MBF6332143.1 hypothetical protein [Nocardia transvalensis]
MTYDKWLLDHWPSYGRNPEYLRITFGWSLLLIVVFCVLTDPCLSARRDNRLPDLDPADLAPDYPPTDIPPRPIHPPHANREPAAAQRN